MKNLDTIKEQREDNLDRWIIHLNAIRTNITTLETLYESHYDEESPMYHSTPAQTVSAYVEAIGYDEAVEIIASLVNCNAWDGRISHRSAEWANAQENAWNDEACSSLCIYTNRIHMAHLDQLARALIKYSQTTPAPAV